MKSTSKTLVIFETSVIRNQSFSYGEINFTQNFAAVKHFIVSTKSEKGVRFGVTQLTIDEFTCGFNECFDSDKAKILPLVNRLNSIPFLNASVGQMDNVKFVEHFRPLQKSFLKKEKFFVIRYPRKTQLIRRLINRSLFKQKPFLRNDKHSDYGFKDVLIWESILESKKIGDYKKVILFSNDKGFDESLRDEFSEHFPKTFFLVARDSEAVIRELKIDHELAKVTEKSDFSKTSVLDFAKSEYFEDHLIRFVAETQKVLPKNISISKQVEIMTDFDDEQYPTTRIRSEIAILGGTGGHKSVKVITYLDDANGIETSEYEE